MELVWWLGRVAELSGVFGLVVAAVSFYFQWKRLGRIESQNKEGTEALRQVAAIRRIADGKDESIWSRPLVTTKGDFHRRLENSIPIMMVASLKGGVGKTTIAANIAASFADPLDPKLKPERVLLIDMDYQGSATGLAVGHARIADSDTLRLELGKAEALLTGRLEPHAIRLARSIDNSGPLSRLHFIGSDYGLADTENRLYARLVLGESEDVRLHLAGALLSDEVQGHFDRIIIDTAPRMTLGFVAAACCSRFVCVPTIMNEGSARSVKDSLGQIDFLRRRVATHMELVGIIPSKTFHGGAGAWTTTEQLAVDALKADLRRLYKREDLILEGCKIRDSAQIREAAGHRLAYMTRSDGTAATDGRLMFAALCDEVRTRAPGRKT
jgi:chromosome partitioning protein